MTAAPATGAGIPDRVVEAPHRAVETGADRTGSAPRERRPRRRLRWLTLVPLVVVMVVIAGYAVAWAATPSVGDAPDRVRALAAAHGAAVQATELPDRVAAAVLAVEDHRFYGHRGIDTLALPRALSGVVTGNDGGGATIEVQLAKWLYTGGRRDHVDQAEQAVLAMKLDARWSKRQILRMYLNTVYFGHSYYGVAAASQGYFGRTPDRLDWAQAALLAAVLKAPNSYDPRKHPGTATQRRNYSLRRLAAVGTITPAELAAAERSGLELSPAP